VLGGQARMTIDGMEMIIEVMKMIIDGVPISIPLPSNSGIRLPTAIAIESDTLSELLRTSDESRREHYSIQQRGGNCWVVSGPCWGGFPGRSGWLVRSFRTEREAVDASLWLAYLYTHGLEPDTRISGVSVASRSGVDWSKDGF
jgi:hypothetical protein